MAPSESSFLGRGWSFPPAFSKATGAVDMADAEDDIRQSVWIILSTDLGERAIRPDFGCPLRRFAFQRIDLTTQTRIKDAVFHALLHGEPRILVDQVRVEEPPDRSGAIHIGVDYTVHATNTRFNLVFPFHVAEGSRMLG